MSLGNSSRAPRFIKAGSATALSRSMLINNLKYGREFKYFDIQKQGNAWFAWFVFDYFDRDAQEFALEKPSKNED